MRKINQNELLDRKIALLSIQQRQELAEIKEQFKVVQESISPANIVQEGLHGVFETVTNRNHLLPTVLSIVGGYISKKVIVGASNNPVKKILGAVLQFAVTNFLTKVNSKEDSTSETKEPITNI